MKKIYENVEIEMLMLSNADIVTLSENQKDDVAPDIFAPNP